MPGRVPVPVRLTFWFAAGEGRVSWRSALLLLHLVVHYALWMWMAAFGHPEREVSTGLHETLGPCK